MVAPIAATPASLADTLIQAAPVSLHDTLAPLTSWSETERAPDGFIPHLRDETARALASTRPAWAVLIARNPDTDPDTLAALADGPARRHRFLRQALLANPATPAAARLAILSRARLGAMTDDELVALATGDPLQILRRLDAWEEISPALVDALGVALEARGSREDVLGCLRQTDSARLRQKLAERATAGTLPLSFTDLAAECGPEYDLVLLKGVMAVLDRWPKPVVNWFVARADSHTRELVAPRTAFKTRTMSRYQARALAGTRTGQALLCCVERPLSLLDGASRDHLVLTCTVAVADALLGNRKVVTRLTNAELCELAHRSRKPLSRLWWSVRPSRAAQLDDAALLALLRRGTARDTRSWLHGKTGAPVTADLVAALAAEPGTAVNVSTTAATARAMLDGRVSPGELIRAVGALDLNAEDLLGCPGLDVVLDLAGPDLIRQVMTARSTGPLVTYLVGRLTARFGDDPSAWAAFIRLAPEFQVGTVTDLLDVIEQVLRSP